MERTQKLVSRFPAGTLVLTISFVLIFYCPGTIQLTLYDRQAILNGEFWRILTAPLTHFSVSHLLWNASVFTIFGAMLENISRKSLLTICLGTSLLSGLSYLFLSPELVYYGGISGVASGIVAYLGLNKVYSGAKSKRLWQLILILLILKIAVESVTNNPLFVSVDIPRFLVLPSAHLLGIVVAIIYWLWELRATIAKYVMVIQSRCTNSP